MLSDPSPKVGQKFSAHYQMPLEANQNQEI